jgi:hypothetical protein
LALTRAPPRSSPHPAGDSAVHVLRVMMGEPAPRL